MELQKPYQHRIMICDRDDFNVLEVIKGEMIHLSKEDLEAFLSEQEQSGHSMRMNL